MNILPKNKLIETLISLKFVCVDVVEKGHGDYYWVRMVQDTPELAIEQLVRLCQKYPNSINTTKALEAFKQDKTWDNFHTTTHYLLIDKIIHYLSTGEGNKPHLAIEQSLRCGSANEAILQSLDYYVPVDDMRIAA